MADAFEDHLREIFGENSVKFGDVLRARLRELWAKGQTPAAIPPEPDVAQSPGLASDVPCPDCGGAGWLQSYLTDVPCHRCDTTGFVPGSAYVGSSS